MLLRLEDDGSDAEVVRRRYPSLAHEADVLLAPYGSALTRDAIPAAEQVGVPCLAPTAGDKGLWAGGLRWTVQVLNPVGTTLHSTLALAERAGVRGVSFLHRDDPFSRAVIDGAADHATQLGMNVAARESFGRERDARRAVVGLPGDMIVGTGFRPGGQGSGFLDDALLLADALEVAGVRPRLTSLAIGAADPAFARQVGAGAEGVLGTTGWRPYLPTPGTDRFLRAYQHRWGEAPDTHAAQAYAAMQLYGRAVESGDSVDAPPTHPDPERGRTAERARVRDALFALETETVFGRYRVDDHGRQVGKTNAVLQWQAGTPVVVAPDRYRTGRLHAAGPPREHTEALSIRTESHAPRA